MNTRTIVAKALERKSPVRLPPERGRYPFDVQLMFTHQVLHLQSTIGNRGVLRVLQTWMGPGHPIRRLIGLPF